jgi:histidinol-phosphate aminotransferase
MNEASAIFNLATNGVLGLVSYQTGKPITELERELGLQSIVKLASNENPLGPSPKVLAVLQKSLTDLSRYPDGNGYALKTALVAKLGVDYSQITLGNGSNEILELIARVFLTGDLSAIYSEYAFAIYPLLIQALGAQALMAKAGNGAKYAQYGHDLDAMFDAISDNTRLIFIANPNNPTGNFLSKKQLLDFLQVLPKDIVCVVDEAYFEYIDEADYPDSISYLSDFPNLIITRTFSKAYGLAGLRIGYSISSPEIANLLNRVREPFNNNSLALVAAETALVDEDYLTRSVAANRIGMQQLTDAFKTMKLNWIPSFGNFVTVDLKRDALTVYQALLQKGVIVRPVANYGLPEHLRISVGLAEENQLCIDALAEILDV